MQNAGKSLESASGLAQNDRDIVAILTVARIPYNFDHQQQDGTKKHFEGISYRAYIAHYKHGEKLPYAVEWAKMPNESKVIENAIQNISKSYDGGVCLYDRFGRFCGISC